MATQRFLRDPSTFTENAAQCPNCFSFNHPEYLPDQKKKIHGSGLLLTCLVCGTPYEAIPRAA